MADARAEFGLEGERVAEEFLRGRGMRVVRRRFVTKLGEIDLIMRDGATIVFVEVKTRASDRLQSPEEAVNANKRRRMLRAALYYLKRERIEDAACRFDVVSIVMVVGGTPKIQYFRDAFLPGE